MITPETDPWVVEDAAKAADRLDNTERGTNGFGSTGR